MPRLRFAALCSAGLAVPGAASATLFGEIVELDPRTPDLFENSFSDRTVLPTGTTQVQGQVFFDDGPVGSYDDQADYFMFDDLIPRQPFTIVFNLGSDCPLSPDITDEERNPLAPPIENPFETPTPWTFTGSIPLSGSIVVGVRLCQDRSVYGLSIDAPRVPEPSTALLTGAALAGSASFLRRKPRR